MSPRRDLWCPAQCAEGRFEALNAPLIVGRDGRYVRHDDRRATYVCTACGSVAVDLAEAAREMRESEQPSTPVLTCPACATVMLPPQDDPFASLVECPECGQRFTVEEGTTRLHGGGSGPVDGSDGSADGSDGPDGTMAPGRG
jgi:DNA-directed RNA polymerase subunit RPC12/RpoP